LCPRLRLHAIFTDTTRTEISTLSLHDALPIFPQLVAEHFARANGLLRGRSLVETDAADTAQLPRGALQGHAEGFAQRADVVLGRSEEHTSELQSRENLVCRLLLEKKKMPAHYS